MFKLERALRYKDTFELPTGHHVEVNFNAEERAADLFRAENALIKVTQECKDRTMTDDERSKYYGVYYALLEVIVGERNAKRMLNAYDNELGELIVMIDPWIAENIIPLGIKASARIRERKAAEFHKNAK